MAPPGLLFFSYPFVPTMSLATSVTPLGFLLIFTLTALLGAGALLLVFHRHARSPAAWAIVGGFALVVCAAVQGIVQMRQAPFSSPLATPTPPLAGDPRIEARFREAALEVERLLNSTVQEVEAGTRTADEGEQAIRRLQPQLDTAWAANPDQNPTARRRYEEVRTALQGAPRANADIFAWRRAADAYAQVPTNASPSQTLRALERVGSLIDLLAAVIDLIRGDSSKAERVAKAVGRLENLQTRYADDFAKQKERIAHLPPPATPPQFVATPVPPRPPVTPTPRLLVGSKAMGSAVLCPYHCTRESLHYFINGKDTPSGAVVTCRVCQRQFQIP
ncbi:MAG TPA: hypothetical protein VGO11_10065 [Chthoniobacteraceae bacterium]|jgi:hypothetical protein|nr:hypothetical protein [Chthoniobacteraceae bacterium]